MKVVIIITYFSKGVCEWEYYMRVIEVEMYLAIIIIIRLGISFLLGFDGINGGAPKWYYQ